MGKFYFECKRIQSFVASADQIPNLRCLLRLTEPLTIIVGYFFFSSIITPFIIGIALSGVAGVMVALSLFELLPIATKSPNYPTYFIGGLLATAVPVVML